MSGHMFIGLTIFFNVFGTWLARIYAQENRGVFLGVALVAYGIAFITWSRVLKTFELGFASSVITGTVLLLSNLIGYLFLNESFSAGKLFFTSLIVVGVIGVNVCHQA